MILEKCLIKCIWACRLHKELPYIYAFIVRLFFKDVSPVSIIQIQIVTPYLKLGPVF